MQVQSDMSNINHEIRECVSDLITVVENGLKPGDVVKVKRWGGFYYHYGVYYGACRVFHCSGEVIDGISISSTDKSQSIAEIVPLHKFTFYPSTKLMVDRSTGFVNHCHFDGILGEFNYSILNNNCEHLANYISTGSHRSYQLLSLLFGSTNAVGIAAICLATHSAWSLGLLPIALLVHYGVANPVSGGSVACSSHTHTQEMVVYKHNYDP